MKKFLMFFCFLLLMPINSAFAQTDKNVYIYKPLPNNPPFHYIYDDIMHNDFNLAWNDDLTKINQLYNLKYYGYKGRYYESYVLLPTEKYSPDESFIILYMYNNKLYKAALFFDKKLNSDKQQYANFTKYYLLKRAMTKNFGKPTAVTNDGKLTVWQGTAVDESSVQDIIDGVPAFYEKYFNYLYETHQI